MEYRKEIDGWRAIAVIPVILFHAGFELFSGGFVGVDIFFVISGYLITSIIIRELEQGTFKLVNFYERRVRRILPALFLVLLVCIPFAWVLFLPNDLKIFGQYLTSSVFFSTNILLVLKGDDYFTAPVEQNPLLHVWSLAVEEQYYILFPVFLMFAWRIGKTRLLILFALLFILSLSAAHWGAYNMPSASFYMLPTRGWELLIGAFAAFYLQKNKPSVPFKVSQLTSIFGLFLIGYATFAFNKLTPFPSLYALVPTIGTLLIIIYSVPGTVVNRLLSTNLLVGIGLISYSAYLWHQPLFAFTRYYSPTAPSVAIMLSLCVMSLFLAFFSWKFVEKPFRRRGYIRKELIFILSGIFILLFAGFGVVGHYNGGFPERNPLFSRLVSNVGLSLKCNGNFEVVDKCSTAPKPNVAILGNSYAMHLVEGLKENYPAQRFVQLTQDSCQVHLNDRSKKAGEIECREFILNSLNTIKTSKEIKSVVISSTFKDITEPENIKSFKEVLRELKKAGKKVLIVGPTPSIGKDIGKCISNYYGTSEISSCDFRKKQIPEAHWLKINELTKISEEMAVEFQDLTEVICETDICRMVTDDVIIYRDEGHLSVEGSTFIMNKLDTINNFLK